MRCLTIEFIVQLTNTSYTNLRAILLTGTNLAESNILIFMYTSHRVYININNN